MSLDSLSPELTEILHKQGIDSLTEPQVGAIPKIVRGDNVLLVAPTGIGKTEAAMLPIFNSIFMDKGLPGIKCIYITPLKSLNRDMLKRMTEYGSKLNITVAVRHGDTSTAERNRQSQHPPEILITTSETLQVMFTGKRLLKHLRHVKWVVIDEIHELATVERGAQMSVALERLTLIAGEFQRIGLSATVGNIDEVAKFLGGTGRDVTICKYDTQKDFDINVECPHASDDLILIDKLQCEPHILAVIQKAQKLIKNRKSTLFFVNTRETAEGLASRFHLLDETTSIDVHHGSLSRENRMKMEDDFKNGNVKALICTSSLELGIDVGTTDLVIQYNSPRQVSRMIQRAGRAGHRVNEIVHAKIIATSPDEVTEALVIARKTKSKELEKKSGRPCPLTVVANQLIAMTMTSHITRDIAYNIFKKAYIFRNLDKQKMNDVLEQLKSIGMLFEDKNGFRRSKKGMKYFYENISMIPNEKSYVVRDISSRTIIGTLDESFVATFDATYATFITKGRTWHVIEVYENELLVEQIKEIGSVPSWTGSDIPVPFEVAMEVGKLRRIQNFNDYPGDKNSKDCAREFVEKQKEHILPSDQTVTIEIDDRLVIINACFGTRVNETLGKIYAALLTARIGESVAVSIDPYRIMIKLPRNINNNIIQDTINSVKPNAVEKLIKLTIDSSSFLRWRFMYVAKKFGIIEKEADYRFINFSKLFDTHKGTPAYDDAVNKVMWEDLDIENTEKVINMINEGSIKLVISTISPIGMEGVTRFKELMQPVRANHHILMALKKRLEKEVLYASCMKCQNQWRIHVLNAPKRFICQNCKGSMVALLKEYNKDKIKLLKKRNLTAEEKNDIVRLSINANLVNENGSKACVVLSGRGIGPNTASKILRTAYTDEDDFLRDILNAEMLYAKNKRFWD